MIAIRFEYKDKLRVGTLVANKVSKANNPYFTVYFGNGKVKSFRWERASNVVLVNLSGLAINVFPC